MRTEKAAKLSRWVTLALILLAGALIGMGPMAQPKDQTATLPDGAESTVVAQLQQRSEDPAADSALVLFTAPDGADSPQAKAVGQNLGMLRDKAKQLGGPLIPNDQGTAALSFINITSDSSTQNAEKVTELRQKANEGLPEGIVAKVTGPAAVQADLANVFKNANFLLLSVTAIIVAVLLIITYRSPVLWLIPLLVIAVADRLAAVLFTYVLSAVDVPWNESTSGILSVLVFGAGTNYALLLISRYRDELHEHESRFAAMAAAWWPTVKTITASASTVVLGVACLLLSAVPTTRGLGLAAVVGVLVALFFGAFVLPGAMVLFGRWIFWPRRPQVGTAVEHKFWDRVGGFVKAKPLPITIVSLLVLGLACIGATQMRTGLNQSDQFIDTPESIATAPLLEQAFPDQDATPATVMTLNPKQVETALRDNGLSERAVQSAVSEGQQITVPNSEIDGAAGGTWTSMRVSGLSVEELRHIFAGEGKDGNKPGGEVIRDTYVGGQDAQLIDAETSSAHDRLVIFPLVLGLVFVALAVLLRSLLAPLIMVATVLLTNISALGIGWWISTGVFGFKAFADTTPLYAFVFLVALGVDYTIFLITRTREEARRVGIKEGVLRALTSTGGVITSAGILLAAVFAALGVLPLVVLAQLGVVIFVGVLLDTLIVRTLLIPSVVQLLGKKFWWPGSVSRNKKD